MMLALGSDHGGFGLKQELAGWLETQGHQVLDLGATQYDPEDDYPDFALAVGRAVADGRAVRGIIICGSGVGACIAANKVMGVRACLCHEIYSAHQGVEHDDMNVLCLGARVVAGELARDLVDAFLRARFLEDERFGRRVRKITEFEKQEQEPLAGGEDGEYRSG